MQDHHDLPPPRKAAALRCVEKFSVFAKKLNTCEDKMSTIEMSNLSSVFRLLRMESRSFSGYRSSSVHRIRILLCQKACYGEWRFVVYEEEVYDIGDTELDTLVKSKKRVCTLVYAPWCPHCRQMKPIYKKISSRFPNTVFTQCDADKYPNVARKHGVKAFPAFVVHEKGKRKGGFVGAKSGAASLKEALKKIGAQ